MNYLAIANRLDIDLEEAFRRKTRSIKVAHGINDTYNLAWL